MLKLGKLSVIAYHSNQILKNIKVGTPGIAKKVTSWHKFVFLVKCDASLKTVRKL